MQVDMVGRQLGMKGDLDGLVRLLHAARVRPIEGLDLSDLGCIKSVNSKFIDMVGRQLGMKGDLDGLIRLLHAARVRPIQGLDPSELGCIKGVDSEFRDTVGRGLGMKGAIWTVSSGCCTPHVCVSIAVADLQHNIAYAAVPCFM